MTTPKPADPLIFDRGLLRQRRDRAASEFQDHNFLVHEIAARMAERLGDINRDFAVALDMGCHDGALGGLLALNPRIGQVIQGDLSWRMAERAHRENNLPTLVADEEALPFGENSLDLVTTALSLHWVNDLPGALLQINRALRPDGLFFAAMLGGETLHELRQVWLEAEAEVEGGASPRVSPFADLRDIGGLMQRAGFALPVADLDTLTATYDNALKLMTDLRGMGETNLHHARRKTFTRRETLMRAAALYQERFADGDGRIPATFQVLYLTGWAPDPSQQQPLKPGSAKARLADALSVTEHDSGEKAPR